MPWDETPPSAQSSAPGSSKGWEVFGVRHGYKGLWSGEIVPLGARDVGDILQQGGTGVGSARWRS